MGSRPADEDFSGDSKTMRKIKEAPFVPIGVAGMIGAVIYGAYNYKNRGNLSTSLYLLQLRVKAQSMVVGAITLGVGYSLIRDYFKKGPAEEHPEVDKLH